MSNSTPADLFFSLINRVCKKVQYPTKPYSTLESDKVFIQNIKTIIELSDTRLADIAAGLIKILDSISKLTLGKIVSLSNINNTNLSNINGNPMVDEPAINAGEYMQTELFILKLLSACLYYNWNNLYIDKNAKRRNDDLSDPSIPVRPPRGKSINTDKKPTVYKELQPPMEFDENFAISMLNVVIRFFQTNSTQIVSDNINHNIFSIQTSFENTTITSFIPEFKPITDIKDIISNIINFPMPVITSYENINMPSLEIFKEIQKYAGKIIFYLSESNWVPIFKRIKSRLVIISAINNPDVKPNDTALNDLLKTAGGDLVSTTSISSINTQNTELNSADITEIRLLEWLCLNKIRLFNIFREFIICFKYLKKSTQYVTAILLRKAIWNWIIIHPHEFGNLWKESINDSGPEKAVPEKLFDVVSALADNNKKKSLYWPLQTMLLIISPECLFSIGLNDSSVANGSLAKKAAFLDNLRKSLRNSRLADIAAFSYVDICRASTFVSKTDGSALRLLVPNFESELKDHLYDRNRSSLGQVDSVIDQQLLIDCLISLLKLNLNNTLKSLVPFILQDNVPFYFKVVLVKSCYNIATERYQLPWNPISDTILLTLANPLRRLFLDNLLGDSGRHEIPDRKQRRQFMEEANEKVEVIIYILKIWNQCPFLALTGGSDINANTKDVRHLFNGLTACALDSNIGISRLSAELLKKLFLPENIEQWDGSSRIDMSNCIPQVGGQENATFNSVPLYIKANRSDRNLAEQAEIMETFWQLSCHVILNISKQLLETKPDVDSVTSQIVKIGLKLLKSLLIERNNYLSIHRNLASHGINHQDRYSCCVVLEISLLVFLCSSDIETSYLAASCFEILSQEAILTGEMDEESEDERNMTTRKSFNNGNDNNRPSHLDNLGIYRSIIQQLNTGVVTSQKVQQKRIRNLLRNINEPSIGIIGAYEEIYRRWYKLTGLLCFPQNRNIPININSPVIQSSNWDEYYNYEEGKKKGNVQRFPLRPDDYQFIDDVYRGDWKNYTGFLCALGGCCVIAGHRMVKQGFGSQNTLSKTNSSNGISIDNLIGADVNFVNYIDINSISRLYSNGLELIDKFVRSLVDLLGSDNVEVRESVKDLLANELSTLLYSNFFRCLDIYMKRSFFDEHDFIICSEKNTSFIENAISIFRGLVDREDTSEYLGSMDLASLIITFIRYVDRLSEIPNQYNTTLRIKVRISQLCDSVFNKKEFARLCSSIKFRNKLVDTFVGWIDDRDENQNERSRPDDITNPSMNSIPMPNPSSIHKESKLHIDLHISCMKTITVLLAQLPLQPEESHEATIEEEKTRLFNKYFDFFIKILKKTRILDVIENNDYHGNNSELSSLLSKSKDYVRWMGPLKDYSIMALSNLLSSNIDIGLKYSLPLGYHEDNKTRAAFMQIFTNILNQVSDFEDLSEENKERVMRERYMKLLDIFTDSDLIIALALCEVASVGDIDEIAKVILGAFKNKHKLTIELIKIVIEKEVNKTESPANLFRRNSMATRLLTLFAKTEGADYLKSTLLPPMLDLVNNSVDKSYEIDPAKIQYGDVNTNIDNLKDACQKIVDAITNSIDSNKSKNGNNKGIPASFIELCTFIAKVVKAKFPPSSIQNEKSKNSGSTLPSEKSRSSGSQLQPEKSKSPGSALPAVGGFIFLRFFCPAIVSPDDHDLVNIPPMAKELRRGLVLCTKVILNLANNVRFGGKETFMIELNEFLIANIAPVTLFLKRISGLDNKDDNFIPFIDHVNYPAEPIDQYTLHKLHYYLLENQEKIENVGKEMVQKKAKQSRKNTMISSNNRSSSNTNIASGHSSSNDITKPEREDREIATIIKKDFEQFSSLLNQLGPAPDIHQNQLSAPFNTKYGMANQIFFEFLQGSDNKSLDEIKNLKVFYEGGVSKDKIPVFYLILRRVHVEDNNMNLLLYHIFNSIKPYFGKAYEVVIDCTYYDTNTEIKNDDWYNILQFFPVEAMESLTRIYMYNVTFYFKRWSKQLVKDITTNFLKKIVCVTSTSELTEFIAPQELKLPKSTILIEKDIVTSFNQVVRITHYRSRSQVVIKINKDSIIITTLKKQDLFGIPCTLNDVIPISDIIDILYSSDPEDECDFVIRYGNDKRMQSFSSPKRDQIFNAIRVSRSRFQYSKGGLSERVLRPGDVPGTLLNMALLNAGSSDATLRLSAYNLLYALSIAFSFDVHNKLLNTKGLCIPSNNVNFIIGISECLARSKPELTLELLLEAFDGMKKSSKDLKHHCLEYISPWIPNLALYYNPAAMNESEKSKEFSEKLEEILRQFIDFSVNESDMYPTIQTKIWKVLGEAEEIVPQVIDVIIHKALEYDALSGQSEVVCNTIVSYASSNVQLISGKVISKLRKKLKLSAFEGAVSLSEHPEWNELMIMIRMILMLSFSNYVFVQQYLPELFHIVTMFVGVGTPLIRASIHGLVVNIIHSLCISLPPESETTKNLLFQLANFVEPKYCIMFGLNKGIPNAFTNISEAMSDPYEGITLNALEIVSNTLLNIMTYGAPNEEISATWKSRWMSLITSTAFQYNPALQPRAFVAMGCLAKDEIDDDLLYQILVALRNALALFDHNECTYIISIVMCLTNVIENLPLDSRYLSPMFWLGITLTQIGNIPLFQTALNLIKTILRTLEANECFVDETVSSYLLKAREPLAPYLNKTDAIVGAHFNVNFSFALSTNIMKGLRHPATRATTTTILTTFLEISSKACGGVCMGRNHTVGLELIGYIVPLLPSTEKLKELFWSIGVVDDIYGDLEFSGIEGYNKIPKILDKLTLNEENAILLATMMATILISTEFDSELIFIYRFFNELANALPEIFIMIYDSVFNHMLQTLNNNQNPLLEETIQCILTTIISGPLGTEYQGSPRRHQLINFLKDIGFVGIPENGTFNNVPQQKKEDIAELAIKIVEAIVS
ncbi:hypothetical protein BCR32DRAFT_285738 [Anaeromyces robustus]|uniref:Ras-GAP domain-containing protein n=1 Tax=Anaeromyces robustus TaxID=1754192 RepID=A0A1Y1WG93_9FUNG|nr:hypothetical protein BCR32DRAFT_285738 [Anaeromyces robustus]|eukprot:ORX72553.1 hypothetical protein BCR32DRAFT_285738 [Anaeromyces robustus]